jgi:hypothetical protein
MESGSDWQAVERVILMQALRLLTGQIMLSGEGRVWFDLVAGACHTLRRESRRLCRHEPRLQARSRYPYSRA